LDDAEAAHQYRPSQARDLLRKAGFEPVSPGSDVYRKKNERERRS